MRGQRCMGKQIDSDGKINSNPSDFTKRLIDETQLLEDWFRQKMFTQNPKQIGFELEFSILNKKMLPAQRNLSFIQSLHCDAVVPEVCKPSLEINANYCNLENDALTKACKNLTRYWKLCEAHAAKKGLHAINIGTLPTGRAEDFTFNTLTELERYSAINEHLAKYRHHVPIHIDIESKEHLDIYKNSVALMGATSAFQIHLRVGLDESVRYYNSSMILSGLMLAVGSNSPFLLNKELWEETRIPLFEQMLGTPGQDEYKQRVSIGDGYINECLFELFHDNLYYPPLVVASKPEESNEPLWHVRLQNGTVHRWIRPIIDVSDMSSPHLRIEYRVLPAGPTITDMIANAALFCGALEVLSTQATPPEAQLPFQKAKENFYNAARSGLDCQLHWYKNQTLPASDILLNEIIPAAHKGLEMLNIKTSDIEFYLDIIKQRILKHQTGSIWQRQFADLHNKDLMALVKTYIEMQHKGLPVHQWPV